MSEVINIELRVTGTGAEKSLDSVANSTKKLNKETKDLTNSTNNSNKSIGNIASTGASAIAAYAAMTAAMAGVIKYGKETIDVFLVQEDASDMVSDAFGDYAGVINDAADATQKLTKIGNEQYQSLAVQAKNFGVSNNEVNKSVQDAIALADLYGAAGADEAGMLEALIDAQNGKTKGLEKYVKELRGVTDEEERARILNEKIAQGWLQASTAGATFGDNIVMIKNAYGDMQEIIGQQILSGVFSPEEGGAIIDNINKITEALDETQFIAKYLGNMREQAEMMLKPFMNLLELFGEGDDIMDSLSVATDFYFKAVDALTLPIQQLWATFDALTSTIVKVVKSFKNIEDLKFQDVLNIINDALYTMAEPLGDVIGLSDEFAKILGVEGKEMTLTAEELKKYNDLLFDHTKILEDAKNAVKDKQDAEYNEEEEKKKQDAIDAANKAYLQYLDSIYKVTENSKLLLASGEDVLEVRLKEQEAIYDITKGYYALNGYTQNEIDSLIKLQKEIALTTTSIESQNKSLEEMTTVVDSNPFEEVAIATKEANEKMLSDQKQYDADKLAYRQSAGLIEAQSEQSILDEALKNKYLSQEEYELKVAELKEKNRLEQANRDAEEAQREINEQKFVINSIASIVQTAMDAELKFAEGNEKKQKEIKKKYALGQASLSLAQIAINTAEGISKATAQTGVLAPLAIPLVIAQGIASAVAVAAQTANIMKMKRGGILSGPSHSNGGIKAGGVEFEGNEAVVNKNTMSNPELANLVSYANIMGGGVPLTNNTTSIIDYDLLASKINDKKVYLVSSDVTTQQKIDNKVVVRAQF